MRVTGGRSVLRIEGSSTPTSRQEPPMSEKPISPLRQRMLEDMSLRGFTPDTQRDYIRAVKKLAAFLDRSPDTATAEDLRACQLHLTAGGVQPPTIDATSRIRLRAEQAAARALARGGTAPAGGGPQSQAQGGAQRCLRGRPAGHGGCRAEGLRH